jgi:hypothetical protein
MTTKLKTIAPRLGTPGRGDGGEGKFSDLRIVRQAIHSICLYFIDLNATSTEAPHPRPLSPEYRGEGRLEIAQFTCVDTNAAARRDPLWAVNRRTIASFSRDEQRSRRC